MPVITLQDLLLIAMLALLEGLLSIDNALVLALQVRGLPPKQQRKALTYGLAGAVVFRLAALWMARELMRWTWVKWIGGGYLVFIAVKNLLVGNHEEHGKAPKPHGFWTTVALVELTDIAFAVDSILAAVALSNKLWIVFTGGFLGLLMIRYASTLFSKLLDRFPAFETSAYLMVLTIGLKLLVDAMHFEGVDFHSPKSPALWAFWGIMLGCVAWGFRKKKAPAASLDLEAPKRLKAAHKPARKKR